MAMEGVAEGTPMSGQGIGEERGAAGGRATRPVTAPCAGTARVVLQTTEKDRHSSIGEITADERPPGDTNVGSTRGRAHRHP